MPEWVEDDVGDDPGTFDSSGAFVSTKEVSTSFFFVKSGFDKRQLNSLSSSLV